MTHDDEWDRVDWQTCAVAALPPGWVNVFVFTDPTTTPPREYEEAHACPAILVQEKAVIHTDTFGDGGYMGTERRTRTVYASPNFSGAELIPVDQVEQDIRDHDPDYPSGHYSQTMYADAWTATKTRK